MTPRVVPLAAGPHARLQGPFMVLEFAEEPALVHVETQYRAVPGTVADLSAYRAQ